MTNSAAKVFLGALTAAGLVAIGAAGALLLRPVVPESLEAPASATTAPAVQRDFADERAVEIVLETAPSAAIVAPTEGRVTRFNCAAGGELVSGGSSLAIDGRPLLDLATESPLWRDIRQGDQGDDVRALQRELAALGYPLSDDGIAGEATLAAAQTALRSIGTDLRLAPRGESDDEAEEYLISLADIVWLPAARVQITECAVPTGAIVSSGQETVVSPERVVSAQLTDASAQAASGERTLEVAGLTAPLDSDGRVSDSAFLAAVTETQEYASAPPADGFITLPGTVSLAVPLSVLTVPAGSLFGATGTKGCVAVDGLPVTVEIVGSELGQTFIIPDSNDPVTHVDTVPNSASQCD